jgi:hypothetical protein
LYGNTTPTISLTRQPLATGNNPLYQDYIYWYNPEVNTPAHGFQKSWSDIDIPSRFWIRIRPEDDRIRVKLWDMCGPEPDDWTYETDSNPILKPLMDIGVAIQFHGTDWEWGTCPEIQFSAIELASSSGTAYLIKRDWPQKYPEYLGTGPMETFDFNDHSGPWPAASSATDKTPALGTAWAVDSGPSWLGFEWHWNTPIHMTTFSTSATRVNDRRNYLPHFGITVNWPWWVVLWDYGLPGGPTLEQALDTGAVSNVSYTMRSVIRPTRAPCTFHFKAEMTIEQQVPEPYPKGSYGVKFFKYTGGTGEPGLRDDGRITNQSEISSFSWSSDADGGVPNWTPVEWSCAFGEDGRLIYGVEITNEWGQLVHDLGFWGGPLWGGPTRYLNVIFINPEIWVTWGEPTADPLNGMNSLPGISVPLSLLETIEISGHTYLDSGISGIAVRDMPRWGWFTETVLVNKNGYFISSGGYIRGMFSVWYTGDHLIPDQDWISIGPVGGMGVKLWRFQLTGSFRSRNVGVGMVTLTYLIDSQSADPAWTRPSRTTVTDVPADRNRLNDTRGLN